jgi:hypothetical protein
MISKKTPFPREKCLVEVVSKKEATFRISLNLLNLLRMNQDESLVLLSDQVISKNRHFQEVIIVEMIRKRKL